MSTSIMIHNVERVSASAVSYSNANSITLYVTTQNESYSITLFNLPAEAADHIARGLGDYPRMNEDEIRADERRKIAAKLGL